jgi:hypothetical protein
MVIPKSLGTLHGGHLGGTTSRLLRLLDQHGARELNVALTEAQQRSAFTALSVAHILDQRRRARGAPVPLEIAVSNNPRVQNFAVTSHSLARYDRLTAVAGMGAAPVDDHLAVAHAAAQQSASRAGEACRSCRSRRRYKGARPAARSTTEFFGAGESSSAVREVGKIEKAMPQETDLMIEVAPGDRDLEEVGRLADGTQFMLTANLRSSVRGDAECQFLVLILFDQASAAASADVRNLGLRTAIAREMLADSVAMRLAELGATARGPILIQPIDPTILGPEFGPITVYSDEEPEHQLTLGGGAIVPGWPFGRDD